MVPAMVERDRLAADVRRAEWLAAAAPAPAHSSSSLSQSGARAKRHPARERFARLILAIRRWLGGTRPEPAQAQERFPERAAAQIH
jgi:hypothetical protein